MVVVAYDIADDRRRERVRRRLMEYGKPVQESVFECFLSDAEMATLQYAVAEMGEAGEDTVRYYVLCRACRDRAAAANGGTKEVGKTVII